MADATGPSDTAAQAAVTLEPAIDLDGLERVLTHAGPTADHFAPHPSIAGAYFVQVGGNKHAVTFRRAVLEEAPPDVSLLTYTNPLLDEILAEAGVTAADTTDPATAEFLTLDSLEKHLRQAEASAL